MRLHLASSKQSGYKEDTTQDELWLSKYLEIKDFIEENHRNPSKHRIEEHLMLNWIKHNRKLLNAGKLKQERIEKFNELLVSSE